MKIVFFETREGEDDFFKTELSDVGETVFHKEKLTLDNVSLAQDADVVATFTGSDLSKETLEAMPNLKLIVTRSTGYDHIDCEACKSLGVVATSVPGYGSNTVAEFSFALLLALSRNVAKANEKIREEGGFSIRGFEGFDLFGKTIGIVGTGRIGRNAVKIAKGFGMNVVAHDLYPNEGFAKEQNITYKSLDELLTESDIVMLHIPYTKDNHHLIGAQAISKMKDGAYIINTARGELIDTSALLEGLTSGKIAGAGLDVLEGERYLKEEIELLASGEKDLRVDYKTLLQDHALIDLPNVIVTPHIAFYSKEAVEQIRKTTVENIKSYQSGDPKNVIEV